jgi:nucleotide sugar dehydrogenase
MNEEQQHEHEQDSMTMEFFPRDTEYGNVNEKPLVAIVGHGFVGKAVERALHPDVERFLVDPNYNTTIDQLLSREPVLTFVCTPTPTTSKGRIDAAVTVDAVLKLITHTKSAVVLKSTATPDVIDKICRQVEQSGHAGRFIYAPEFLTEKNADHEYCHPQYMVFGGMEQSVSELLQFLDTNSYIIFPKNTEDDGGIHVCHPVEASFVKYAINAFLAMKVTFFNQLWDAMADEPYSVQPLKVLKMLAAEPRLGNSHWRVPGPDNKRGFGGACFPKDVAALTTYSDKLSLLEHVLDINNEYRKEYDLDSREVEQNIDFGKGEDEEDLGDTDSDVVV